MIEIHKPSSRWVYIKDGSACTSQQNWSSPLFVWRNFTPLATQRSSSEDWSDCKVHLRLCLALVSFWKCCCVPGCWHQHCWYHVAQWLWSKKEHSVWEIDKVDTWATTQQNQQNDLCAQWRLINLGIHPVSSVSPPCAHWVVKDPVFLHVDKEDWADAQADLRALGAQVILLVLSRGGSCDDS